MRISPRNWILAFGLLSALFLLPASDHAAPPKRKQQKSQPTITRKQAQEAKRRKEELRHKLGRLGGKIKTVKTKIHKAKAQEHQITENIEVVEGRISRTRASLARVNRRLTQLSSRRVQIVQRLEDTQRRLSLRRHLLSQRLLDNYQHGQASYAQVLLRSRSMHDLLSRQYYVRQIVESDTELIAGIKEDIKQIEADKRALEEQQREQKALADEYETQKQQLAEDLTKKQEILANVQETRHEAETELDDLEEEANAMTERIRALSELLKRRQAEERIVRPGGGGGIRPLPRGGGDTQVWRGGFIRPVSGPQTSGFGYRFHPILHRRKMHTGIDFGSPHGAPIHAAGGGTVILAEFTRGYGNCVIIDHGNGTTTLYGHCSALLVSYGQTVSQGQVIARVGATGMATGPHLHFEVRRNGVPVQPF